MSITLAVSCSTESELEDPFANLPPNQLNVTNIEGTIKIWNLDNINEYYIEVFVKGTIDSVVLGFVDDLNDEFKQDGLKVIFSGTYEKSDNNPRPRIGGQDIYSLTLTSISPT